MSAPPDAAIVDLRNGWQPTLARAADTAGEGGDNGDTHPPAPAENARRRHEAKAERERADAAETKLAGLTDELRSARMEAAFVRSGFGVLDDLDAAWKLADKAGVTIADDGTVTGMEEVVSKLLD